MPGPNSGVHGLICVDKEGTACTKVVLQSRVLIGRWHTGGLRSHSSWDACGARLSFSRFSVFLLFGVFSGACLFGFAWPWRVVCWSAVSVPSRRRPGWASSFSCVCSRSWSSRPSFSSSWLVGASVAPGPLVLVHPGLRRCSRCFCVCTVSRLFSSCGVSARWRDLSNVVFRHLRQVVFPSWQVASEFF